MATTHAGHIGSSAAGLSGGYGGGGPSVPPPSQTNLDRNTVDMDRERASFADNAVKYEATLRFINANVKTTLSAITGQVGEAMSMLSIFNVSGSAASAQSQRLNVVASNLANVDTVAGPNGQAYKARQVTFQTQLMGENANDPAAAGVRVSTISEDQSPGRRVHDRRTPARDADGYVTYSNVNAVEEMVNTDLGLALIPEQLEVMNTAKTCC